MAIIKKLKKLSSKSLICLLICFSLLCSCFCIYANAVEEATVTGFSVNLNPSQKLYSGTAGVFSEYDPVSNSYFSVEGYNLFPLISSYTFTYSNNTSADLQEFEIYNAGYRVEVTANQAQQPLVAGQQRTAKAFLFKGQNLIAESSFTITLTQNPIKSISCRATKELMEGDTQIKQEFNPADPNQPIIYDVYYISMFDPLFTIIDQNDVSNEYRYHEIGQEFGVYPTFTDDQTLTNVWGVGNHTASASLLGHTCNFEVTVAPNPIESFTARYHGEIIAGTYLGGNAFESGLDTRYLEFIVKFLDGRVESYYVHEHVGFINSSDPLRYKANATAIDLNENGTWEAGKHEFKIEFNDRETTMTVDVIDKQIKEISAKATTSLVPDWHAYGHDNYKYLSAEPSSPEITITYLDGSTDVLSYNEAVYKFPGNIPFVWLEDNSIEGFGNRTAHLSMFGKECEFQIEVIENPIKSIVGKTTKPLYKGFRGDFISLVFDGGLEITANFKDGTSFSGTPDDFVSKFSDQPFELFEEMTEPQLNTTNIMPMSLFGQKFNVEYYYSENPLKIVDFDAKLVDGAKLYENQHKYNRTWYDYEHLVWVTLYFNDGSTYSDYLSSINDRLYELKTDLVFKTDAEDQNMTPWKIGKHKFTVNVGEMSKELEIELVENPYKSAKLTQDENLKIELIKKDNTTETLTAHRFVGNTYLTTIGILYTDKGNFNVTFKHAGGLTPDYSNIYSLEIAGVLSTGLSGSDWLEKQIKLRINGDVPEITIANSREELKDLVTTEADYVSAAADKINAYISAENISDDISKEESLILDKAKAENNLAIIDDAVLDLSLYKYSGEKTTKFTEVDNKIKITITIPENQRGKDEYSVIHIHNGVSTILKDIDTNPHTVTFETDKFSTFAMVYKDAKANETPNVDKTDTNSNGSDKSTSGENNSAVSPNTRDSFNAPVISILAITMFLAVLVIKKSIKTQ